MFIFIYVHKDLVFLAPYALLPCFAGSSINHLIYTQSLALSVLLT
nr:MAG TPA: hypothetical protein [Caudoviricetes sp.]